ELFRRKARPFAVDFPSFNWSAKCEKRTRVTVIRSARTILTDRTSEFRHRHDYNISHAIAKVAVNCGKALSIFPQPICELAAIVSLIGMRIPAADFGKCHFETDICLYELRDLHQRLSERRPWILRAVFG